MHGADLIPREMGLGRTHSRLFGSCLETTIGSKIRNHYHGSLLRTVRKERYAYPMDWQVQETRILAQKMRETYHEDKERIERARAESANVSNYGKYMFEKSLSSRPSRINYFDKQTAKNTKNAWITKVSGHNLKPHTGPTRYGSPLYNKRANMMSTIRTRASSLDINSDTNDRLPNALRNYITKHNENFRLASATPGQKLESRRALFIKKLDDIATNTSLASIKVNEEPMERPPKVNKGAEDDVLKLHLAESATAFMYCSIQEHTSLPVVTVEVADMKEEHPGETNSSMKHNQQIALTRPSSARSLRSNTSSPKSRRGSINKRPKDWIDTITVSSNPPPNELLTATLEQEALQNRPISAKRLPILTQIVVTEPVACEQVKNSQAPRQGQDQEPMLPSFICPSSEDKSREYAVRLWLERTDFNHAIRTVPLA